MVWVCDRCGSECSDDVDECQSCKEAERPFYRKNMRKEGEDKLLLTLRLNKEERAVLDEIKAVLDISSDGGALKIAAFRGWGVLQRTLGKDNLAWLCSQNRQSRGQR